MTFYLGVHMPTWLNHSPVPLFVSAVRLRRCKRKFPRASCRWALDSGGFSELSLFGGWRTDARQYAAEVRRWRDEIGGLEWVAAQDWMCEDFILRKTGRTVEEHQTFTLNNYLVLMALDGETPWVPVLQGYRVAEYMAHLGRYERQLGFPLSRLPLVGVGSVCRRQGTREIAELFRELATAGLRLHGFGVKAEGLRLGARHLTSADSMAWSFQERARSNEARKQARISNRVPSLFGCPPESAPKTRANDFAAALAWRERLLTSIGETP